ncbi:AAA family ATPase [Pseudarthrobacter psychrotolerans]|uniref:AAA family ATPase n=1 Tax=Pseudarthrobacter psychrotolerans TaxID=2697569 RepID=A0A6P1NPU0_9MICC|nr:LuxR C-terminal-related transcriptional regulator [Pseudarthrobacter psychrotolerans]QHK19562.1 AAA family ATPase [Pseudarthrobacter psychrotolerans]
MSDTAAQPAAEERARQAKQLLGLLGAARSGVPSVAIIRGGKGMGKTRLLEWLLRSGAGSENVPGQNVPGRIPPGRIPPGQNPGHDSSQDVMVLRAAGAASEQDLPFGTMEQLLAPQATRPRGPGSPGSVSGFGDRLLGVMDTVSAAGNVLVLCVSDLQLADAGSLRALLYALRRAGQLPVLTILTMAPDRREAVLHTDVHGDHHTDFHGDHQATDELHAPAHPGEIADEHERAAALEDLLRFPGAHTMVLGPLTPADVQSMWRPGPGPGLSMPAARALVDHTGGDPRLIRSLLEEFPLSAWYASHDSLPAPTSCVASTAAALKQLSADGTALTQAAAVLGRSSPLSLAVDLAGIQDAAAAVAAVNSAAAAGLLQLSTAGAETRLEFPLPVLRSAVYQHLGPALRSELHTAASRIMGSDAQKLKHRAAAALLPDGDLAAELEATAEGFAAQGAWRQAAEAYTQAARLHPQPAQREKLVIRTVDAMVGAGNLGRALAALDTLDSFAPGPLSDAVRGYLAILRGRPAQADALLQKSWTAVDPATAPETAAGICQRQVLHALARFHGRDLVMWAERARKLVSPESPAAVEARAIEGLGLGAMGRHDEAERSYRDENDLQRHGAQRLRLDMGKGWLHLAGDDVESARDELAGAVPTDFSHGSQRIALWAQGWLARADFTLGAWDDALGTVQAAAAAQEESGLELLRPLIHWTGAQIHALRGDWDSAADHLEQGAAPADSYPVMLLPYCLAQAQVAETKADYDGVLRALVPILRMPRTTGIDEPGFWPWQDHYANALVMTGRVDEADAFLVPHERLAEQRRHRSSMARLAYVRGRIHAAGGNLDAARSSFLGGLRQLDGLPMPYARARVKFAYGQSFRRAGKRREAATMLTEARDLFEVLGAGAYVERCSREMRASGVPSRAGGRRVDLPGAGSTPAGTRTTAGGRPSAAAAHRGIAPQGNLTEQEKAVADLVAAGLSNKEAAAELYVSVKTVQYHLTRIYAKFHVTSRSGLAAVYSGGREHGGADGRINGGSGNGVASSKHGKQAPPQ